MAKLFSTTRIPAIAGRMKHPHLRRCAQNEDGSMTIFACFMILMMLMVGGIGVDLMRNEMERVRMQHTADRAVLAAADLDQRLDPEAVVLDYFDKAGLGHLLSAEDVDVEPGLSTRTVAVNMRTVTPTNFMKLLGVEELPVRTRAAAIDQVPNIEISLVLDISGSMRNGERMDNLRPAAKGFVDTVLAGNAVARTSVNLVPYAGQTNPGPFMFERLNGVRYPTIPLDEADGGIPVSMSHGTLPAGVDGGTGSLAGVDYVYPNISSCIDVGTDGFSTSSLPAGALYPQTAHFMNWSISLNEDDVHGGPDMDWGWCPQDQTSIQYMSNNHTQLNDMIHNMRMHDGTGTHYAMKWALALLDPSSRDDMTALINANLAPEEFRGRPADYSDIETSKYIVLMTDGRITEQVRPRDTMDIDNLDRVLNNRRGDRTQITGTGTNVNSFFAQCELAKNQTPRPVVVFTIAFDAPGTPEQQMRDCASSPAHFFQADNTNIQDTFKNIARQINQLRLTQ